MARSVRVEKDSDGRQFLVRRAFRPEDYTIDAHILRSWTGWRHCGDVDEVLALHDGPFASWKEIGRYEKDGRKWVLLNLGDWFAEAEVAAGDIPEVRPLPPREAYETACRLDGQNIGLRTVHE